MAAIRTSSMLTGGIHKTWTGLTHANIIKTGERSYCLIAEWKDIDACTQARLNMVATLNSFRDYCAPPDRGPP